MHWWVKVLKEFPCLGGGSTVGRLEVEMQGGTLWVRAREAIRCFGEAGGKILPSERLAGVDEVSETARAASVESTEALLEVGAHPVLRLAAASSAAGLSGCSAV